MNEFLGGETTKNPKFFETKQTFLEKLFSKVSIQALPATYTKVFDISYYQGDVNFKLAKASGYEMVILKVTEGLYPDSKFTINWQKAVDSGILVGVYHFFRSNVDGKAQADYHLNKIRPLLDAVDYKLYSALDIETVDGTTVAVRQSRVNTFWNTIKTYTLPGCYSSTAYWQSLMGNVTLPDWVYGWIAAWNNAAYPVLPKGWTNIQTKYWQYGVYNNYSWAEPVPGVTTDVDVDRWFGTLESLNTFLAKDTLPTPAHSHPELEHEIGLLKQRVTALEQARVYFIIEEDIANTYRVKELNNVKKPIMVPANDTPNKLQYHKNDRVQIIPLQVDADGSTNYWKLVGKELYLREEDGYVEL